MRSAALLVAAALPALVGCAASPEPEPLSLPLPPPVERALALEPAETALERAFLRGLVALKLGDYARASREIGPVAEICGGDPIGVHALLTLASAELDPRNADGDPSLARRMIERYFLLPERPAWTEPTAETLYLLALDVDVSETDADGAGSIQHAGAGSEESSRIEEDPIAAFQRSGAAASDVWPQSSMAASADLTPESRDCAAASYPSTAGALQRPYLPRAALAARLAELARARDSLQANVDDLEGELKELRQELERIRETLRP